MAQNYNIITQRQTVRDERGLFSLSLMDIRVGMATHAVC